MLGAARWPTPARRVKDRAQAAATCHSLSDVAGAPLPRRLPFAFGFALDFAAFARASTAGSCEKMHSAPYLQTPCPCAKQRFSLFGTEPGETGDLLPEELFLKTYFAISAAEGTRCANEQSLPLLQLPKRKRNLQGTSPDGGLSPRGVLFPEEPLGLSLLSLPPPFPPLFFPFPFFFSPVPFPSLPFAAALTWLPTGGTV